ncbi:hypothetical protein WDU94_007768 [Cyamophila willieti]
MVSPRFCLTAIETFGLINNHRFESQRRARLQTMYTFVNTRLLLVYVICQGLSVVTRAIRYYPEFIQCLLDHTIMWCLMFIMYYFQSIHREMFAFATFLDALFSKADAQVTQKCHRQSRMTFLTILTLVGIGFSASGLETVLPISADELDIRRQVYRTTRPERRLPFNIKVPFLDESESPTYEILFALELYLIVLSTVLASSNISVFILAIIHIRAQYEILCKYIVKVGHEHRDELGYRIFYTNIERNECNIQQLYSPTMRRNRGNKRMLMKIERLKWIHYEKTYMRQIVKFHQKLLTTQDEVGTLFMWMLFLKSV